MIEHGDGRHGLGVFSAAQAATGGSREKSFVKPDVGRVLSPKLFGKRIDTDASEAIRGIRFEQRAVVTADVDDDIVCFQVKTVLDAGGHPSQVLAHRDIGVRSVAVVVGIKLSGRNRVLQLDKLTIRAAHHNQRRQWRVALALSGKPAGKSLHPKIQDWLKIAVPANPAG